MEIPKYIFKKIEQQNALYERLLSLKNDIDNWADKSGINIYDDEYKSCMINPDVDDKDKLCCIDVKKFQTLCNKIME